MRESKALNKRREMISELKELIELYQYKDNICLASEKVDLSKYREIVMKTKQNFKIFQYGQNNSVYKTRR